MMIDIWIYNMYVSIYFLLYLNTENCMRHINIAYTCLRQIQLYLYTLLFGHCSNCYADPSNPLKFQTPMTSGTGISFMWVLVKLNVPIKRMGGTKRRPESLGFNGSFDPSCCSSEPWFISHFWKLQQKNLGMESNIIEYMNLAKYEVPMIRSNQMTCLGPSWIISFSQKLHLYQRELGLFWMSSFY